MKKATTDRRARRQVLKGLVRGGLCLPLAGTLAELWPAFGANHDQRPQPANPPAPSTFSQADHDFLYELECLAFRYFWEQASPSTGLVKDRCNVRVGTDKRTVARIA